MMRLFLLLLVFVVGWGASAATDANASPLHQTPLESVKVTELAAFFPDTTDVFAAVRIDAGMTAILNDLLVRMGNAVPGALPSLGFETMLDMGLLPLLNAPFSQVIRPWLGDTLAVGMVTDNRPVFVIDITDANAARTFIQPLAINSEPREWNGYPMFETRGGGYGGSAVVIQESRLIFALDANTLNQFPSVNPLTRRTDFGAALSRLPSASYNAVAFVDLPALLQPRLNTGDNELLLRETMQTFGALAFGLTILRGEVLAFDAVALPGIGAQSVEMPPPVYVSIANRLPADAPFVLMGSDIGTTLQNVFNLMRGLDMSAASSGQVRFNDVLVALNFGFTGFTGLRLENDLLTHLRGDSAFFFRLLPDLTAGLTPDIALISEIEGETWRELVNTLPDTLAGLDIEHEVVSLGNPYFVLIPIRQNGIQLDFALGQGDEGFALVGTAAGVGDTLAPRATLYSENKFRRTLVDTLPSSQWIGYFNILPLARVLEVSLERGGLDSQTAESIERLLPWLSVFPSGTFSAVTTPDGVTVARLTLTVGDEPLMLRRMVAPPPGSGFAPPTSGQPSTEIAPPNADAPNMTNAAPMSPPLTAEPPIPMNPSPTAPS